VVIPSPGKGRRWVKAKLSDDRLNAIRPERNFVHDALAAGTKLRVPQWRRQPAPP
jgi:hypothetical protein